MTKITTVSAGGVSFYHKYDQTVPAEINTRHSHENYELFFLSEGEGIYMLEGGEYSVSPGTVIFTRPHQNHSFNMNPEIPYERRVVSFPAEVMSEAVLAIFNESYDAACGGCYYPTESVSPYVVALFERFELAANMPERERALYMQLLVCELIVLLSAAKAERISYDDEHVGAKVKRYINENITKEISLDDLSRRFFVSKYYLCRAFKRKNGTSIHGYITHKRIMYAKRLIDGGESAAGAAYKVGFCDYSAFYRAYVKIIGKSPCSN